MNRSLTEDEKRVLRSHLDIGMKVVTNDGIGVVTKITRDMCTVALDRDGRLVQYDYKDVAVILRGFGHLNMVDAFKVCDIILGNDENVNYKPNFNFFPSYVEITGEELEESKIKVQIYNTFDIIDCDTIAVRTAVAHSYLKRRGYDLEGLARTGMAIIDPMYHGI